MFSEGERTAISLAAFLAEVGTTKDGAGLIFDDPVSSLDHNVRSHVARRLAKEAKHRQVIVFTHDLTFFADLRRCAKDLGVACHARTLLADEWLVGTVEEDMPFGTLSVSKRVRILSQSIDEVAAAGSQGRTVEAGQQTSQFYSRLRGTWERFIEECMFGDVVVRLEKNVRPGRFDQIAISDEIKSKVNEGYTRCSDLIEGHDHAPSAGYATLTVADLREDLKVLQDAWELVRLARKRPR